MEAATTGTEFATALHAIAESISATALLLREANKTSPSEALCTTIHQDISESMRRSTMPSTLSSGLGDGGGTVQKERERTRDKDASDEDKMRWAMLFLWCVLASKNANFFSERQRVVSRSHSISCRDISLADDERGRKTSHTCFSQFFSCLAW